MDDLKKQNRYLIFAFVAINAFIFWCVWNGFYQYSGVEKWLDALKSFSAVGAVLVPLITIFINGLISAHWKSVLVFVRIKNPLPGSRAFTEVYKTDARIDRSALEAKLGEFPVDPDKQNALWYGLYTKHQDKTQVLGAHKVWLLTRDLTGISFLMILFLGGVMWLLSDIQGRIIALYILFLLAQCMVMQIVANNYGNRFVTNVLSVESHSD